MDRHGERAGLPSQEVGDELGLLIRILHHNLNDMGLLERMDAIPRAAHEPKKLHTLNYRAFCDDNQGWMKADLNTKRAGVERWLWRLFHTDRQGRLWMPHDAKRCRLCGAGWAGMYLEQDEADQLHDAVMRDYAGRCEIVSEELFRCRGQGT